ncbi:hypothetical protein SEMRO_3464_G348310.1 [Seminavis robusta]|uniref:Uncharacterized protein n=1 Tax=Seminavis robusta TaxID=568900 RepID=A0A9N8F5M5_9STRA|nr:hypothetical protein SEMRO_3464_G348310.1 [Seminavis robusta]|eukprot:Sro3464_g348310.1 n/a (147) ;mRNA; r:5494-5934
MANLIKSVLRDYDRLLVDCEAYGHDMAIILQMRKDNPPVQVPWHRSEAKPLLEKDIDEKKHLEIDPETGEKIKPRQLYQSRVEYREYKLKVFRDHLYQEVKKRERKQFRFEKKNSRTKTKQKLRAPATVVEGGPTYHDGYPRDEES